MPFDPVSYQRATASPRRLVQMAARACGSGDSGGGTQTSIMVRVGLPIPPNTRWGEIVLTWGNFLNMDAYPTAPITIRAAVEDQNGFTTPCWWEGSGGRDIVMDPGAVVSTRPLPVQVDSGPSGTTIFARYLLTVASPINWGTAGLNYESIGGSESPGTDKTMSGSIAVQNNVAITLSPIAVVGVPDGQTNLSYDRGVAPMGDSISAGAGDTNTVLNPGWVLRGLGSQVPWTQLSVSGNTYGNISPSLSQTSWGKLRMRLFAAQGCKYVMCNMLVNDVSAGTSYATIISRIQELDAYLKTKGKVLIISTGLPCTNIANTTYSAAWDATKSQTRLDVNTWIRTNPLGHGYFDAAATAQLGQANPVLWRDDLGEPSYDGTHPNPPMHEAIGNAFALVVPQLFT